MNLNAALNWRYATKRMNGATVDSNKLNLILDAIALAPSSFGLQPYTVIVVENKEMLQKIKPIAMSQPQITEASALLVFAAWEKITSEKIEAFIQRIAEVRNVSIESLKNIKKAVDMQLNNSDSDNLQWSAKQAYIALGIGLVAAASEEIDSTPMEGFDKNKLDELLQLKDQGLRSMVLMTVGYRDMENDYLAKLKKVRREKDELFIYMP